LIWCTRWISPSFPNFDLLRSWQLERNGERSGARATLLHAGQSNQDIRHALYVYPPDPTLAPAQDLRAEIQWLPTSGSHLAQMGKRSLPQHWLGNH